MCSHFWCHWGRLYEGQWVKNLEFGSEKNLKYPQLSGYGKYCSGPESYIFNPIYHCFYESIQNFQNFGIKALFFGKIPTYITAISLWDIYKCNQYSEAVGGKTGKTWIYQNKTRQQQRPALLWWSYLARARAAAIFLDSS